MKKGMICVFMCMLMLVGALFPAITASHQPKPRPNDFTTVRRGFFIGYFESIAWEEDRCILTMDNRDPPYPYPVVYVIPFKFNQLGAFEQIQLVNPKYCIIKDHFIVGFSQMLFPKSTLSMHILSQEDHNNIITWVIDEIEGDNVWGSNIKAYLYRYDNSRFGVWTYPYPWKPAYMNIGDEFKVIAGEDGTFQLKIFDAITGRVLFCSSFIKF